MIPDKIRQSVLIDIAYECGGKGLAGFTNMLAAYRLGKWATAAAEIKSSKLYMQVPMREQRNIMILTLGEFPSGVSCIRDLIKLNEGLTLTAKPDAQGKWAYGYGEDIEAPKGLPPTITIEQAEELLDISLPLASSRAQADVGSPYWFTDNEEGKVS